jgi:ADP-ribose pyrophosphatase YjhB (NUDIX family)
MKIAARAIIIKDNKILVMYRNKYGSQFYTLVGGRTDNNETPEQAVIREVKEETGMDVTRSELVFKEQHRGFYSDQYIYLCQVKDDSQIAIQENSEEGLMNKLQANIHRPEWTDINSFSKLPFRTIQLQNAIIKSLKDGFPTEPIILT